MLIFHLKYCNCFFFRECIPGGSPTRTTTIHTSAAVTAGTTTMTAETGVVMMTELAVVTEMRADTGMSLFIYMYM